MRAMSEEPDSQASIGRQVPTSIEAPDAAAACTPALWNRVGRVLQDLAASRALSDAEIRQHAQDCTQLMEAAYQRFEQHHNPADRDEACLWMHRRDEANRSLSPAWKAAREAQIQRDIAQGQDYFAAAGERDRAALAKGSAR